MNAKIKIMLCAVAVAAVSIMAVVLFQIVCAILTFMPTVEKFDIDYIKVGRAAVWLMENQQNDYDNVRREPKIYFFMSNKIIKDEAKLFDALLGKFDFPKDVDFYLYVYKKSRRLNKYWSPDYNKFFFDIIDMHYEDLYLILKCKNDTFEVLEREECLFKD